MESIGSEINQVFVKLLDGKHTLLNFSSPSISVSTLKHRIQTLTSVPIHHQLLSNNSRILHDDGQTLTLTPFPLVVNLSLRLRGGKGGFGSLLRGAATKAGQKKTNNFDACRDMSGRRLRHVNAEKKLEEWRAEAEERKLEKMAEDFLKKKMKEVAKSGKRNGSDSADKYVDKYREQSEKCMEAMEKSVRESVKEMLGSKRKGGSVANEADKKRMKIWLGKRKFGESDSDSEDIDEDDGNVKTEEVENEKSVVIDNGSLSDSSKEADRSSGSITGGKELEIGFHDRGSSESGSEEEVVVVEKSLMSSASQDASEDTVKSVSRDNPVSESPEENMGVDTESKNEEIINEVPGASASELDVTPCPELNSNTQPESVHSESVTANVEEVQDLEKPLNFEEYHSAKELEVLGLEKLKSELQARGLKCGGTLPERAARLFLLKSTPLDKLPKKLFAKK